MDKDLCDKCRQEERDSNPGISIDVYITCNHNQPERLNPEDHFVADDKMVCDSLNSMET